MINMSVIHIKDIIKNLVKFVILIGSIAFITRFFLGYFEDKKEIKLSSILEEIDLLEFLDSSIPGMKEMKQEEEKNINPITIPLDMEIKMAHSMTSRGQDTRKETENQENGQNIVQGNMQNENQNEIQKAETGLTTQVQTTNVPDKFTDNYNGVQIKNGTSYQLTQEMLTPDVTVNKENIMIFHTHTCESYTPSVGFEYQQTGTYRTTDYNFNVARVGTELENQLLSYGFNVIHDKTYHDYPAYNGSYDRSLRTVQNLLTTNANTDIVIDIHRDAIGDYTYAPKVQIGEDMAAQLMFVIGTDGGGKHDNWLQNLKFAVKVQEKANEMYPGLFKSIVLRNSRYNQHLAKAACIIEVGATGNTMEECLNSMKYLAKVLSEI